MFQGKTLHLRNDKIHSGHKATFLQQFKMSDTTMPRAPTHIHATAPPILASPYIRLYRLLCVGRSFLSQARDDMALAFSRELARGGIKIMRRGEKESASRALELSAR